MKAFTREAAISVHEPHVLSHTLIYRMRWIGENAEGQRRSWSTTGGWDVGDRKDEIRVVVDC